MALLLPTHKLSRGRLHTSGTTRPIRKRESRSELGEKTKISLLLFLSLFLLGGCASPQKAIYLAPTFEQVNVHTITILPIVDSRAQRQFEINESELQQIVNPVIGRGLIEKGYTVEFSKDISGIQCLKWGRSVNLNPDCLRSAGPPNPRWVLVLFLQDFQTRTPYGGAVSAKMSGVLFDKAQGLLLWKDLEYARLSQRELVGSNMDTLMTKDVFQICTRKLIGSLPQRRLTSKGENRTEIKNGINN